MIRYIEKLPCFFAVMYFMPSAALNFFFIDYLIVYKKNDKVMIGMARSWLSWYLNRCYRNLYGKLFFLLLFKNMSLCQSLSLLCFFFKVIKECLRFVADLCRFSNVFFSRFCRNDEEIVSDLCVDNVFFSRFSRNV